MFREIIGNETSTKNAQFLSLLHRIIGIRVKLEIFYVIALISVIDSNIHVFVGDAGFLGKFK